MYVTLLGMLMEVRPEQPEKASSPILVTLLGIIVFLQPIISSFVVVIIMPLQLFLEPNTVFSESTLRDTRLSQPEKA